ncbi:hypothetical protein SRHO_G00117200 [Serrasalmus rhombeus]
MMKGSLKESQQLKLEIQTERGAFRASDAYREDGDEDELCVFGAGAGPADDHLLRRSANSKISLDVRKCRFNCSTVRRQSFKSFLSSSSAHALGQPRLCCFTFVTFKIPDKDILQVVKTHDNCSKSGYVYTTSKGKLCKKDLQKN